MVKFYLKLIMSILFGSVDNTTAGKLLMSKCLEFCWSKKKYDLPCVLEINFVRRQYFKFNNEKLQLVKIRRRANKEGISRKLF